MQSDLDNMAGNAVITLPHPLTCDWKEESPLQTGKLVLCKGLGDEAILQDVEVTLGNQILFKPSSEMLPGETSSQEVWIVLFLIKLESHSSNTSS